MQTETIEVKQKRSLFKEKKGKLSGALAHVCQHRVPALMPLF